MLVEGTIKWLAAEKGFGFIKAADGSSDYFFHMSCLEKGCRFDALKEGDAVEFRLRPSTKKPGQKEAFDIKPTHGTTAVQERTQPTDRSAQSKERTILPYGFLPINLDQAITAKPVLHDGSSGGDLLSGEILCELEALTPLLPGNMRYRVDQAKDNLKNWDSKSLPGNKQIVEPLRLPDGRVVIAGTALKGMIRQSLSALTSAPMERVGERHFTYRPNLKHSAVNVKYECRPAIVQSVAENEIEILVLPAQSAIFIHSNEALSDLEEFSYGAIVRKKLSNAVIDSDPKTQQKRIKEKSGGQIYLEHYYYFYSGGIDGSGILASAHAENAKRKAKVHREALVSAQYVKVGVSRIISDSVLSQYRLTQNILANDELGHISNSHPLIKHLKELGLSGVKESFERSAKPQINQLIYVEISVGSGGLGEVVSFGHNYQYRWAYTSSIPKKDNQRRSCLSLRDGERALTVDGEPSRLTGARLLFGYVRNDNNPIGQGAFERLAGRIAINHAVTDSEPRFLGDPAKGYCIPLKILGQPKPSAWEFYLQQPTNSKGPLNTYGDLPGDAGGELAGRKFYRHQPGTSQPDIEASVNDSGHSDTKIHPVNNDQATLARFICQPGTHFRFAIRFARLRAWELGALLAVLEPHRLAPEGTADVFAHKLGLGRPLGMGSVRISRSAIRARRESETEFLDDSALGNTLSEAMCTLREKLDHDVVRQWLELHRMVPNQRLGYPLAETKVDNKMVNTIYAWHTSVRREYSQLRRQKSLDQSALANKIKITR